MKRCPSPCPVVTANRTDLAALRAHLLEGFECLDAWLALSELVTDVRQRRDCLERAAVLAPENEDLQIAYLEAVLVVEPDNRAALNRLNEIRTLRLLADVKTSHFHEQPRARLLGDILVSMGAISASELREVLKAQQTGTPITTDRRLGQLLLRRGLITPGKLAHALIIQQQERSRLRIAPQVLGEYLVEQNYITPQQLELALAEQLRLDQKNQRLSLGQILVRLNMVSEKLIERVAREHEQAFWAKYGY
ncbi:MAG: hypothetical protein N2378_10235 [Chloroflexaceae bacterium]|nr:hypothetical protein [Chloroflexaceae bacterium]